MIGLGIILALTGIILLIAGAAQASQNRFYATGTETVVGKVTHKHIRRLKNGTAYLLMVSYIVDGTAHEKTVGANLTEFQTIHEGDTLELIYKVSNPKRAVRQIAVKPRNVNIVLVLGAVLVIAGIAVFYIGRM